VPRSGADVGDPPCADGVAVALVLGVSERGEDDALLGGHDRPKLDPGADARNRGVPDLPGPLAGASGLRPPHSSRENPWGEGGPMFTGYGRRRCRSPARNAILTGDRGLADADPRERRVRWHAAQSAQHGHCERERAEHAGGGDRGVAFQARGELSAADDRAGAQRRPGRTARACRSPAASRSTPATSHCSCATQAPPTAAR
jgi:hypothetical protein